MGASDRRARGEAHAPVRTDRRALSAGGRASVRFRSAGAEVLSSFDGDVIGRGLAAGGAWRVAGRRVAVGPRGCRSPPRHGLQTEPAGPYQLTIPPPAPCSYSHGYATASLYVLLQPCRVRIRTPRLATRAKASGDVLFYVYKYVVSRWQWARAASEEEGPIYNNRAHEGCLVARRRRGRRDMARRDVPRPVTGSTWRFRSVTRPRFTDLECHNS